MSVRQISARTIWLMVGAAIGLAAGLLLVGLAQVLVPHPGPMRWLVTAACLLPVLLIGLLPGVREIEVAAVRRLLDATGDLVVPARPRSLHRWRLVCLVTFHLAAGLVAAVLLVGLVPGAVVVALAALRGRTTVLAEVGLPDLSPSVGVPLALATIAGCLAVVAGLGRLAAVVALRLLGPTAADRLEVALARLATESEHTRLARELHDGIGHALSIVSVQAAAGRRTLDRDPEAAAAALATIESTARAALTELDTMLGLIRDGTSTPAAEPGLDRLPALVTAYRSAGMDLTAEIDAGGGWPRLVSTTAYRIAAEALTNAQRYATNGPVTLRLDRTPAGLTIEARSPAAADPPATGAAVVDPAECADRTGLGLRGIAERVALFGGTFRARRERSEWVLRVEIPMGPADG